MTSYRFSRWRISTILDCRDPIMGSLAYITSNRSSIDIIALNCFVFLENRVFAFWRQDPRWRISAILDFRGPIIGSLKSACTTSYRSSIDTIVLNWLVFEKIAFFCILATDRQTNGQTVGQLRCVKPQSLYRELRHKNREIVFASHCMKEKS